MINTENNSENNTENNTEDKIDKKNVWLETKKYCEKYNNFESIKINYDDIIIVPPNPNINQVVEIKNVDMIDLAIYLKKIGYNPLIHNMCDWEKAGGCVDIGSPCQEEELFRRSNYLNHLHQKYYPIKKNEIIFSTNVSFFRYDSSLNYKWMPKDEIVDLDIIAAPASRFPQLSKCGTKIVDAIEIKYIIEKIILILKTAINNNNDIVIFSAWGCGAFGCPPKHMAKIFYEVIKCYYGYFKYIIFAIKTTEYDLNYNGSNYHIFRNQFKRNRYDK